MMVGAVREDCRYMISALRPREQTYIA